MNELETLLGRMLEEVEKAEKHLKDIRVCLARLEQGRLMLDGQPLNAQAHQIGGTDLRSKKISLDKPWRG